MNDVLHSPARGIITTACLVAVACGSLAEAQTRPAPASAPGAGSAGAAAVSR